MSIITATDSAAYPSSPGFRPVMRDSSGLLWALSQPSGTAIHRHTSPDGITWTDRGALSLAVAFSAIVSCQVVTVSGTDSLIIVANVTGGWETWVAEITGTTLGTAQTATVTGKGTALAAYAQAGNAIHVAAQSGSAVSMWHCDAGDAAPINIPAPIPGAFSTVTHADFALSAPELYLTLGDTSRNQISVVDLELVGAGYIVGALESAVSGVSGYHTAVCDNTGQPNILYAAAGGTQIGVVKRTGTASYSGATLVAPSLNPSNGTFSAVAVPATSKIFCAYDTAAAQSNGEVYLIARSGGYWVAATLMAGGDNAGYQSPRLGATVTGSAPDLVYLTGTSGTRELDFVSVPISAPPNAPASPTTGYVTGLLPTLSAGFSDSAPNDGHQFSQNQVASDSGGATIIEDSGQISQTGDDWAYPGGATALTFGTTFWWRRRDWDLLSASGAGAAGPYCAWTPFTPVRGGTPVAVDTVSAGQPASAITLYAPIFVLDYSWTHPDTDDGSAERVIVYEADGVTVNTDTGFVTLSPVIASGGTGTTNPITSAVVDGRTYKIVIQIRDATTGVVSTSAPITVTASFLPPDAPTGFSAVTDPCHGTLALTWSLDGTDATVTLEREVAADDPAWEVLAPGITGTSLTIRPNVGIAYNYRLTAFSSYGIASTPVILTDSVLAGKGPMALPIWLIDTETGASIALGAIDSNGWDSLTVNRVSDNKLLGSWRRVPLHSVGMNAYREGTKFKFLLVGYTDTCEAVTAAGQAAVLEGMWTRNSLLRWTDPQGLTFFCRLYDYDPFPEGPFIWAQFRLTEDDPPLLPFL